MSRSPAQLADRGPYRPDGLLVIVRDDPRLFAKLVSLDGQQAEVEFFSSVGGRARASFAVSAVSRVKLQRQTRVFVQEGERYWSVGRVLDVDPISNPRIYSVRFPNNREADVDERELFVRCLDVTADPADVFLGGGMESQFFADRRASALARLSALSGAVQGMTGLLSAGVELLPHQINAVRRILQDPVPRYLLADEVGLGKTIEAGAIVRQVLIDNAKASVAVLVPRPLVGQWRYELAEKFRVDEFGPNAVRVLSHEEALALDADPDLLVIDEAHHAIVVGAPSSTAIRHMAQRVGRLLLLSATPPIGDEDRLFDLLNLLDPLTYRPEDRRLFRRKVEERQEIGRLLLSLRPGTNPFLARRAADAAKARFPDDSIVAQEVEALHAAGNDRPSVDGAVRRLRDYLAETWRIHHRVIRARRADLPDVIAPRGPTVGAGQAPVLNHVRLHGTNDVAMGNLRLALDEWREAARGAVLKDPLLRPQLTSRCWSLYDALFTGEISISGEAPLFPGEANLLQRVRDAARMVEDRASWLQPALAAVSDWLDDAHRRNGRAAAVPKLVAFSSSVHRANLFAQAARKRFGGIEVSRLETGGNDVAAVAAACQSFATDRQAFLLVCDRSAEEGLNLHIARGILHLDLPLSPERLEQRIGRVDRVGRKTGNIQHRVILPDEEDGGIGAAWFSAVANGFVAFNQSLSDVQFVLRQTDEELAGALFELGSAGLSSVAAIRERLDHERVRLEEQHTLDSVTLRDDVGAEISERMEEQEDDPDAIEKDFMPWMTQVLGLEVRRAQAPGTLMVNWTEGTMLPELPWKQLLGLSLKRPVTWDRLTAEARPGLSLLRPGTPLIDSLARVMRWDDRGIVFATWRITPEVSEPSLFFRLDWVIEAHLSVPPGIVRADGLDGLRRRAMSLFPPFFMTLFLDAGLRPVEGQGILSALAARYGDRDLNLGSRREVLYRTVDPSVLHQLVPAVRRAGEEQVRTSAIYQKRLAAAHSRLAADVERQRASLARRLALYRSDRGEDDPTLVQDLEALDRLTDAVEHPHVRLDAFGLQILAPHPPEPLS